MRSLGIPLAFALILVVLIPVAESAQKGGLADRVAQLEAQVAAMEEILQFVYVETEPINNLAGPHWIIEGANVHVRSGSGDTHDGCVLFGPGYPSCESLTGLGNVIVGYNEVRRRGSTLRTGSHNVVVGRSHSYSSFGGLVAGLANNISGAFASVSGGQHGFAVGDYSSVSGGSANLATGDSSSVSGGFNSYAAGDYSSVSGGFVNTASGDYSSVSGGSSNEASGTRSSVSGGVLNEASGQRSSVSGGQGRDAPDDSSWAAGSLFEEN